MKIFILSLVVAFSFVGTEARAVVDVNAPVEPTYEVCTHVETETYYDDGEQKTRQRTVIDHACLSRNQAKENQYNQDVAAYNAAQAAAQAAAAQTEATNAQAKRDADAKAKESARSQVKEIERQHRDAQGKYGHAKNQCKDASNAFYGCYAASWGTNGGCLWAGIAFDQLSRAAGRQADKHARLANEACQTVQQVSSVQGVCQADVPYTQAPYPDPNGMGLFDPNGRCIGDAQACATVAENLPPGVSVKDVGKGQASFASKNQKPPFVVNPDGSITMSNGKKVTEASFTSEKSMLELGMKPNEAKSLMASLNKMKEANEKALASVKPPEKYKFDSGSFAAVSGASSTPAAALKASNGELKTKKEPEREPTSTEGLAKNFNGELIGVPGDDIFKMMNRRYNLKASQDSFIEP